MNLLRRHLLSMPLLAALPAMARGTPLRMAVVDLMPWAGRDISGRQEGASVDMARLLASQSGLAIVPHAVPYARAIAMLNAGDADLMLAIEATESGLPPPLAAVGAEEVLLIGRRGTRYASQQALVGHRVGVLRPFSFAADLAPGVARYETGSYEQGLRMLTQGRLDAVAGVRSTMEYAMRQLGLQWADVGAPLVIGQADISLYLAPRAATPDIAARLQQACAQLLHQKKMPALLSQYRQAG